MKKLLFTLLGLILTVIRVSALDFTVGDFSYTTLEDNKVAVVDILLPENSDVVIPSTVTYENIEYTVTEINRIKNLEWWKSLYIPETIETIENITLANLFDEEFIVHPDNQFFKTIDGCLYSKDGTKFIACPCLSKDVIVAEGTIEISKGAFLTGGDDLESVILPKSLEIIGEEAFAYSHLKSIYIPENVKVIKSDAFYRCSINTFEISSENQYFSEFEGCIYSKDYSKLITCHNNKKTVSFHPNVLSLEENVFSGCYMIEEIVIPNTIKSIPKGAFYDCSHLKKIFIPESVESINDPFWGCRNLEYLIIPNSVQSLSVSDISPIKGPY
ncbi:MAG: leucine-rich repeat domain-containing protein, partial [Duncaniella sp.]|nr:leucine-rich repeat domain-containing protein [Duncaniella sp.]